MAYIHLKLGMVSNLGLPWLTSTWNLVWLATLAYHGLHPLETWYGTSCWDPSHSLPNSGLPVIYFLFPDLVQFWTMHDMAHNYWNKTVSWRIFQIVPQHKYEFVAFCYSFSWQWWIHPGENNVHQGQGQKSRSCELDMLSLDNPLVSSPEHEVLIELLWSLTVGHCLFVRPSTFFLFTL